MSIVEQETETITEHVGALQLITSAEIDTQIATAKKYPRSIKAFIDESKEMACLSVEVASECMYSLKRSGKVIEGPSARFAEIIASSWGNCRAGARIIDENGRFVTAQGVFTDMQRNVSISYEVRRRITTKSGATYGDDMIAVTANAACSIAMRNAVLKGIPKAFWSQIYNVTRKTAIGDATTLNTRRQKLVEAFGKMGVDESQILTHLEVKGIEDVTLEHLALMLGIFGAIKDGDQTIDDVFGDKTPHKGEGVDLETLAADAKSKLDEDLGTPKRPKYMEGIDDSLAMCSTPESIEAIMGQYEEKCNNATQIEKVHAVVEEYKKANPKVSDAV